MSLETAFIRKACARVCIAILLFLLGCAPLAADTTTRRSPQTKHPSARRLASSHKGRAKASIRHRRNATGKRQAKGPRGQQIISSDRTRQIQGALIREHYLDGEPSGAWDQRTKDALTRYQADNGWQTKITPDSRALIKLGLGPSHDGLLNPDSAALTAPYELGVEKPIPGGR